MVKTLAIPIFAVGAILATCPGLDAQVSFAPPTTLSQEGSSGADPGLLAAKVKLARLTKTPSARHDGRLVAVYADANHTEMIWEPKGGQHLPRDIFVRFSDDLGTTWSGPVNVSGTARFYSAMTDWDADLVDEKYWGDSGKPTVFNSGDNIVITWVDKYAPENSWTWGTSGISSVQGEVSYTNPTIYPFERVVPYAALYAAISYDGGATWEYGVNNPPLQLTYGRRDPKASVHKGSGARWVMGWQEDPEGLQLGGGSGPGEGGSGAHVSAGTDALYSYTTDLVNAPTDLVLNRTPLSNHSAYNTMGNNGYPTVGSASSGENHGASRANISIVKDGSIFQAIVAYEETKGLKVLDGKTVQYHAFPFDEPPMLGSSNAREGEAGAQLSDIRENGRRVRLVTQSPDGVVPAIAVFWRQGIEDEGGSADIMLRMSTSLHPTSLMGAPQLNLSSDTPTATPGNLLDPSSANPLEDSRAHRAWLRGSFLVVGYSYTPNGPLARYTDLENYNFWIRRTMDNGQTWLAPQNISNITDKEINVLEPRLVGPAKTGTQDDDNFIIAWGTETNVYEGIELPEKLDIYITRTTDQGATFEPVMPVANTTDPEFESQLRINDDASEVYATWMHDTGVVDALFTVGGHPLLVMVSGSPVALGGVADLTFVAPGFENDYYVAGASFGTTPGMPTPWGTIPLNNDLLFQISQVASGVFVNFHGPISPTGTAVGSFQPPNLSVLNGLSFYVAFVAIPSAGNWGISNPSQIHIK